MTKASSLLPGIRYKIRGLSAGVHPISLTASADLFELAPFIGTIEVTGEVRAGEYLHFVLHLKGVAEVICDRCAKQIAKTVESDIDVFFIPEGMSGPAGDHLEVFSYDPHSTQEIDLTEIIRDNILLAIPMKNLCEEGCEGIETEHWEPEETQNKALLRSLYDKLREEEMNDGPK